MAGQASAQVTNEECGPIWGERHHGPYDYRRAELAPGGLPLVENVHFTPEVEAGIRGKNGHLGDDLSYTLRAFPNHHRAMLTMIRATQRRGMDKLPGMRWTMECYFNRATRFAPDDTVVRGFYAEWLGRKGRLQEAEIQLQAALRYGKDNPLTHYSAGLIYLSMNMHERALEQAHKARAMGVPHTELADLLKREGKWRDPAP